MSLDEHATLGSAASMSVGVLPVGGISEAAFGQYLGALRGFGGFRAADLHCVSRAVERQTPFAKRSGGDWPRGVEPQVRLRWREQPRPDEWADLQPCKEVVGVVGVCRGADVGSLEAASAEFRRSVAAHRFAQSGGCYRLCVFEPPDGTAEPADRNVILIPATESEERLEFYLNRLLEDFVSQLVEKVDEWVLDLDGNMPLLQTKLDTRNVDESQLVARRRAGRMSKYMADCALMSGSPLDARELYLAAIEECRGNKDKLWHASALEGLCCAELVLHGLLHEGGADAAPRPVDAIRRQLIDALDIYGRCRLDILENECCMKLVAFLIEAWRDGAVPWIQLADAVRWSIDFSDDLSLPLRLRLLEKVQSVYAELGCRRKVAFFMQVRARLLREELMQTAAASELYAELLPHYVGAGEGGAATAGHRLCFTHRASGPANDSFGMSANWLRERFEMTRPAATAECHWPRLGLSLYNWLADTAQERDEPIAAALWQLRALASPALLGDCLPAEQQEAMAATVQSGLAPFPASRQGKDGRPRLMVRMAALDQPEATRPRRSNPDAADHGPFLYSSFMARDAAAKKQPVLWVSGEVASASVELHNPLLVPVEVSDATLVVDDPFFDATPQSLTLGPGESKQLWLSGICGPLAEGTESVAQRVLGLSMTVFGAIHDYPVDARGRYAHRDAFAARAGGEGADASPPAEDAGGLEVTVLAAVPKLVARLVGCDGEIELSTGEEAELQLVLSNSGGGRCTAGRLALRQRALARDGRALPASPQAGGSPGPVSWAEEAMVSPNEHCHGLRKIADCKKEFACAGRGVAARPRAGRDHPAARMRRAGLRLGRAHAVLPERTRQPLRPRAGAARPAASAAGRRDSSAAGGGRAITCAADRWRGR